MERVGQERADCKREEQTAALNKAGTRWKQNEPAKRRERERERETRSRNCDAPGGFGISIMSKALGFHAAVGGKGGNSSVKYRPEGHVFNSEYIIRGYLPLANGPSA